MSRKVSVGPDRHRPKTSPGDPGTLGAALSQLFALKNLAGGRTDAALADAWKEVAGPRVAAATAVLGVNRGVLQIGVANSAMMNELVAFHQNKLVEGLKLKFPALKLRAIKFRLKGDLPRSES